jgi:prolyl-tRNA editing enzyme YbaK/EbsC (Cys-tRNA(Pro) deacylase)
MRVRQLDGDKRFVMLVMPADRRLDNQKARHVLQAKDIRFAREEEIATLTNGVQVGAVPPFGNLFGLDVIADPGLFDNERIVFNAGDRRFSIAMRSDDFQRIARPRIADITAAVVRDDIDGLDDRGEKRQAAFDRILGAESASLPRDPANLRAELDEAHDRSGR